MRFRFTSKQSRRLLLAGVVLCAALPSAGQEGVLVPTEPVRKGRSWTQTYEFKTETRLARKLILRTDAGFIHVRTTGTDSVTMRVIATVVARDAQAARAVLGTLRIIARPTRDGVAVRGDIEKTPRGRRAWVRLVYEIEVPRRYNVGVETGGGGINIETLDGAIRAVTAGGNIVIEDVTGSVNARSAGGNIRLGNIGAAIEARTAGGMIHVGNIEGDAALETSGGAIIGGRVAGAVEAITAGGDIVLEAAGGRIQARTLGGQIHIGESGGTVQAQSSGGSVIVAGSRGAADIRTMGGSIELLEIKGSVHAQTLAGSIRALIEARQEDFGESELLARVGDITVYLPEGLAFNIEAKIDGAVGHKIKSDFPLQMHTGDLHPATVVSGSGEVNGGGKVLKIRTTGGDIYIIKVTASNAREIQQRSALMRRKIHEDIQRRLRIAIQRTREPHWEVSNRDHDH